MESLSSFITDKPSPLNLDTTIEEATAFMELQQWSHFPVFDQGKWMGNLDVEDLHSLEPDQSLRALQYSFNAFAVLETQNWFEVLQQFAKNQSNLIPVLDASNRYLGFYVIQEVVSLLLETPFLLERGVCIRIEKASNQYSFSEISQIVETSDSRIYGLFISKNNADQTELALSIDSNNINQVIQSLRRHEYRIVSSHVEDDLMSQLRERSEYLNKYLNI